VISKILGVEIQFVLIQIKFKKEKLKNVSASPLIMPQPIIPPKLSGTMGTRPQ